MRSHGSFLEYINPTIKSLYTSLSMTTLRIRWGPVNHFALGLRTLNSDYVPSKSLAVDTLGLCTRSLKRCNPWQLGV